MFGYPTGVGCLIAKQEKLEMLSRPWFAGGNVVAVFLNPANVIYMPPDEGKFEDGTVNFANIPLVAIGLKWMRDGVGIDNIHKRVTALTDWTIRQMLIIRYSSNLPLVKIYGPTCDDPITRGGIIAFNLFKSDGKELIPVVEVEEMAKRNMISLRTGCFCNPGVSQAALEIDDRTMAKAAKFECKMDIMTLLQGMVRISFGTYSTFQDAWTFISFLKSIVEEQKL
eukprot:TRINITY_DN27471_c0_g1_i1.p2 TRINITY_DN27471_c0_g1~~TRINITY_DN27471_c0_g1_i1.p2  ORF type:complete len:225 (-),score=58.19 TRINITY_DN27471_c0_g1_i1:13-687(-)